MRWKDEHPKHGEERVKEGFLLFPKTIQFETRWLEKAKWEEKAHDVVRALSKEDAGTRWFAERWIDD